MRLPLGILTGVGSLGGGAIFKRGSMNTLRHPGGDAVDRDRHRTLLRSLGFRARVRQQDFGAPTGRADPETLFDIVWKQPDIRAPNLDFLTPIREVCTVKSFKLLSNDR